MSWLSGCFLWEILWRLHTLLCLGQTWGFFVFFFYLYLFCLDRNSIISCLSLACEIFSCLYRNNRQEKGGLPGVRHLPSPPPPIRTKPPQLRAWPSNLPSSLGEHRAQSQGFTSAQGQRLCAGQSHFCGRNRLLPGLERLLLEPGRLAGKYVAAQQAALVMTWLVPSSVRLVAWMHHIWLTDEEVVTNSQQNPPTDGKLKSNCTMWPVRIEYDARRKHSRMCSVANQKKLEHSISEALWRVCKTAYPLAPLEANRRLIW